MRLVTKLHEESSLVHWNNILIGTTMRSARRIAREKAMITQVWKHLPTPVHLALTNQSVNVQGFLTSPTRKINRLGRKNDAPLTLGSGALLAVM